MKSKSNLIILNIFITVVSIYFTYAVFVEYKKSQQIKIEHYVEKMITQNKITLQNTLIKIRNTVISDKSIFKDIHTKYTKKLRENPKLDIFKLKKEILSSYNLRDKEIHLFLLNKEYTITNSTYLPDIGFKLGNVLDARLELDKTNDGKIYQSPSVSIDIISSEIKSYSYSKINDELYFEMGFIDKRIDKSLKSVMEKIQVVTNKNTNLYRVEQRLDGSEYYDNILEKKTSQTKEEYLSSKTMFPKNKVADDPIIQSNRLEKAIRVSTDEALIIYIPLIKKNNTYLKLMGDFVLKLYIDRSYENQLNEKINFYFQIFLVFHILFLLVIFFFTKRYHDTQIELNKKMKENQQLLNDNKNFINTMAKQIETPLSVIINNYSFIEKDIDTNLQNFNGQINSSINMLENSYEDLTYIVNNEKHNYPVSKINLKEFLTIRIDFFDVIAKAQGNTLSFELENENNTYISINETELERLIDNNISNTLKYGESKSKITIRLKIDSDNIILQFLSTSKEIQNKQKIFEQNFQEGANSKKSLGLGLSMVKSICEKYDILYKVIYKDNQNIFIYNLSSLRKV